MPRPKRADEKNGIYHALNRGNGRSVVFHKDGDYEAFENILAEGLVCYPCRILSYQLMPNHWHFVLQPTEDGGMSNFMRWVTLTHTMRYHAHYQTAGEGLVYQGRFKSFPVQDDDHFHVLCRYVERNAQRAKLVERAEDWRWRALYRWVQSSAKKRIEGLVDEVEVASESSGEAHDGRSRRSTMGGDGFLSPLYIDEQSDPVGPCESESAKRCSDKGFLAMPIEDYPELLDWTARQTAPGRFNHTQPGRGCVPRVFSGFPGRWLLNLKWKSPAG